MKKITIAIGTDHRGYSLKEAIKEQCLKAGEYEIAWVDVGTDSEERTDYPLYADKALALMKQKKVQYAVLLCATGTGMAIAANRHRGIYAAVIWVKEIAYLGRQDDNINVLVFPSDFISQKEACESITIWLSTPFKEDRYAKRLEMVDAK